MFIFDKYNAEISFQKQLQKFQYHYSMNAVSFGNIAEVECANRNNRIFAHLFITFFIIQFIDNLGQKFYRFSQVYKQVLLTTRKIIRLLSPEIACQMSFQTT